MYAIRKFDHFGADLYEWECFHNNIILSQHAHCDEITR